MTIRLRRRTSLPRVPPAPYLLILDLQAKWTPIVRQRKIEQCLVYYRQVPTMNIPINIDIHLVSRM